MSISRIYQPVPLQEKQILRLDEKASHHLARVLRAAKGDELILFNGKGGEYHAVITHIDKKGVDVEVGAFAAREVESPINLYLAQGIARGEKMDFIVQKAVELGVSKIFPLITERCNVRLDQEREEKRLQHWQSVVVSACEQSGRQRLPEIAAPILLKSWLPTVSADYKFVLSPHVGMRLEANKLPAQATVLLLIGPEGGLSDAEVELANQHGFTSLQLGPRVLRTETAAIAALAVFQNLFGDLG